MDKKVIDYFIWISGPINSGKTTIAKTLIKRLNGAVNIELDTLSAFDINLDIDQKLKFIIQDGLDLAKNWADRNFIPILNWPIYGKEIEFLQDYSIKINIRPIVFNLIPSIDIVKTNRGERSLEEWELNRIDYMYSECKMDNPILGQRIDNSFLSVGETTEIILQYLSKQN